MTTNATVIRFMNERVRPDCEKLRSLYAMSIDFATRWASTIAPALIAEGLITIDGNTGVASPANGNADTLIDDGRAVQGVAQISISELCLIANTFGGLTLAIQNEAGFINAVSKASVRALEA